MQKPVAVIANKDNETKEGLKKIVDRFSHSIGLEFEVRSFSSTPDLNQHRNAQLYIVGHSLPNKTPGKIAAEIEEVSPKAVKILTIDEKDYVPKKYVAEGGKEKELSFGEFVGEERERLNGQYRAVIPIPKGKTIDPKRLESEVSQARGKERAFSSPIRLAIVGYGRFGKASLSGVIPSPLVEEIGLYSESYLENNPEGFEKIKDTHDSDKITLHKDLVSLVRSDPDVIFVATGTPFKPTKTRNELFQETAKKVYPLFQEVVKHRRDHESLIIMGSNPIEALMRLGQEMGINPLKLVGESVTDTVRARKLLVGKYLTTEKIKEGEVEIDVIGSRQQLIPILSSARIRGRPIKEFRDPEEFKRAFLRRLRKIGLSVMKGAEKSGDHYSDAPRGFVEMIDDLTHLIRRPTSCWTSYDTANNGFYYRSIPVNVVYPSLDVYSAQLPELDEWEKKKLDWQKSINFSSQRRLGSQFVKELKSQSEKENARE